MGRHISEHSLKRLQRPSLSQQGKRNESASIPRNACQFPPMMKVWVGPVGSNGKCLRVFFPELQTSSMVVQSRGTGLSTKTVKNLFPAPNGNCQGADRVLPS